MVANWQFIVVGKNIGHSKYEHNAALYNLVGNFRWQLNTPRSAFQRAYIYDRTTTRPRDLLMSIQIHCDSAKN